jgi:MFS superfamily sulfate permease-like transporter
VTSILLRGEFIVAITILAVRVPYSMTFSDLAGVTPVAGLIVTLGAMVMDALFTKSKQVVTEPKATSAILTASAVVTLSAADPLN